MDGSIVVIMEKKIKMDILWHGRLQLIEGENIYIQLNWKISIVIILVQV